MKKYVAGFLFSEDRSRVALVHKDHGPAAVVGRWNAIGGKRVDNSDLGLPDESADAAMWREFIEETGVSLTGWTRFLVLSGPDWEVTFFEGFDSAALGTVRSAEAEEIRVWLVEEVLAAGFNCVPNLRWILPMCLGHRDDHVWVYKVLEADTFAPRAEAHL